MQAKIQFNCVISPYPAQKIVNLPLFKMNMELKEHFNNKIFKLISETADELGLECYVVGGYVRGYIPEASLEGYRCSRSRERN